MAQTVNLTPSQYESFNELYSPFGDPLVGTPISGGGKSISGYDVPADSYNSAYSQLSEKKLFPTGKASLSLPEPVQAAAPDNAGISKLADIQKAPTYDQFVASQANRGPVIYSGGAAPAGMNAQDASVLQNIYAPKSTGGFVPEAGLGAPPEQFAAGGAPSGGDMASWTTKREASDSVPHTSGLFKSDVPGRTDRLDSLVPAGSYVIPADVVSGLGEGNTMAGSNVLDKMFHTDPYGIQSQPMHRGVGIPATPGVPKNVSAHFAKGGHTPTRIIAAGGEYLVNPDAVKKLGGGDINKGHKILDHFVLHARKQTVKQTSKLPGPKR